MGLKKKSNVSVPVYAVHVKIGCSRSSRYGLKDSLDFQIIFQAKLPDYGPKALFPLAPQKDF